MLQAFAKILHYMHLYLQFNAIKELPQISIAKISDKNANIDILELFIKQL